MLVYMSYSSVCILQNRFFKSKILEAKIDMNGIKNALIPIFLKYGLNKGYILAVFRTTTVTAILKRFRIR